MPCGPGRLAPLRLGSRVCRVCDAGARPLGNSALAVRISPACIRSGVAEYYFRLGGGRARGRRATWTAA
eukprot:7331060-Prymnesium_polylepis.1